MKTLNSFAFVGLSLVAVSGVQADEPVKPQQQPQATAQQAEPWQWVKTRRPRHWQLVRTSHPAASPASKPSEQAATASTPAKTAENLPVLLEPPRRSYRHRLRLKHSSNSSVPISPATAPVSNSVTQPLPQAK
ncbi:MAG: hypothetical protein JNJ77_13800 [Planctomycetia bacterium]|nr:hypothetical protein [Planctomycetia bacterium]